MVDMGCPDQGFTGNAAKVEAVSSQFFLFFHKKSFGAKLCRPCCNGKSAGATAYNTDIEIIVCHEFLQMILIIFFWTQVNADFQD